MILVKYNGIEPQQKIYSFGVQKNNNYDLVIFELQRFDYLRLPFFYVKVCNREHDFFDKIQLENIYSEDENVIRFIWKVPQEIMAFENVEIQLQVQRLPNDAIWQTKIVVFEFANTIDTDQEISKHVEPSELAKLEEAVENLESDSITSVQATYVDDTLNIKSYNSRGEKVGESESTIPTSDKIKYATFDPYETTIAQAYELMGDRAFFCFGNCIAKIYKTSETSYRLFKWTNEGYTIANNIPNDTLFDSAFYEWGDFVGYINEENIYTYTRTKVDKVWQSNKVYGTDNDGNQISIDVDHGTDFNGSIARRDDDDQLHVPATPTENAHATSKQYVDNLVSTIKRNSYIAVDTTIYPTLADFLASDGEEGYMYLYPVDTSDLTQGYKQYIWEGSAWVYLGDTNLNLTPYPRKDTAETITGNWTFTATTYASQIGDSNNRVNILYVSFLNATYLNGSLCLQHDLQTYNLGQQNISIGTTVRPFKNIVLWHGILSDANGTYGLVLPNTTSWTADKEIATTDQIGFKRYTASDFYALSSDEKIECCKHGVIIDGTVSSMKNPILMPYTSTTSAGGWGVVIHGDTYEPQQIGVYSIALTGAYAGMISLSSMYGIKAKTTSLEPSTNSGSDVGSSSYNYRYGYFSGQVYAQNTFNVINATDIVNNTLTQAQYDLITNGKPTLIKGELSYSSFIIRNYFITNTEELASNINCFGFGTNGYTCIIKQMLINKTTLAINLIPNSLPIQISYGKPLGIAIGNKDLPAYPSNTGTFAFKQVNGTLSWQQEWYGTQAEYDALGTYDSNTIYNILEN